MATLIPSLGSCSQRMTPGERRLAQRLEAFLEDDYLLWYDVPIGSKQLHPDFLILHPGRGLFILEVKDWRLDTIAAMSRSQVTLHPNGKKVQNPLEQARTYAHHICQLLEHDPELVHPTGSPYAQKLMVPYGYGVVLTTITRKQFMGTDLGACLDPDLVICQDEMTEGTDPGEFQERLWNCQHYRFGRPLTAAQIDRIRWHIFPEIRITPKQLDLALDSPRDPEAQEPSPAALTQDVLRVMDLQQEQLARSLGEGHRVIHGVAGSGKTLILAFRCLHLAAAVQKPILVLCFNVSLGAKLRQVMQEKGLHNRVIVRHFHAWCQDGLRQYRLGRLDRELRGEAYLTALVDRVIQACDRGEIPKGRYSAVMVDEGHDFQPHWLKLIAQQVDPDTNSLLILYDDAQNLYGKGQKRRLSFKQLGIQAQGRTTILKINYRNTAEVLTLAYEFAKGVMDPATEVSEDTPVVVHPQSAGRHGPLPQLIRLPKLGDEAEYIGRRALQMHERGIPWQEMAVVYRSRFMGEVVHHHLQRLGIPVEWVNANADSRFYRPDHPSVKVLTMHASKGLEFFVVFIPGVGLMPYPAAAVAEEARLLYVAMTRSIEHLILTYDRPSVFVEQLQVGLDALTPA